MMGKRKNKFQLTEIDSYDANVSCEIDDDGQIHVNDPIKCSKCGSYNTELGDDYVYCLRCKHEHVF